MLWLLTALTLYTAPLVLPTTAYPLTALRRGQQGQCYTVFEDDKVEPFAFEVKGVLPNFLGPQADLVMVKLLGERTNFTGVVAGMSGSPCVLEGKLLGALSYAFAMFAKEPMAGITPIAKMLEIWQLPSEARPWRLPLSLALGATSVDPPKTPATATDSASPASWQPIATPLMLGNVPNAIRAQFTPWLRSLGFEPVAAGAAGSAPAPHPAPVLQPGSSVSVIMVRGDMDMAATGTVSWMQDKQLLAFGHPFSAAGSVSWPLAHASIVNIMASSMRSFKMSVTGDVVGEVTQDRLTGIGADLSQRAQMIPVDATLQTARQHSAFHLEVARDPFMSARLVAMSLAAALAGRLEQSERGTVRYQASIELAGQPSVSWQNVFAAEHDAGLLSNVGMDVGRAFGLLWELPEGVPPAAALRLHVDFAVEAVEETIEALYADQPTLRPGATLQLAVRLRQRDSAITQAPLGSRAAAPAHIAVEHFQVPIPSRWAGQKIRFLAAGAAAAERFVQELQGTPAAVQRRDVLRYLRERRSDGFVYVLAVRQSSGLLERLQAWPALPDSAVTLLSDGLQRQSMSLGLANEQRRARPGVVRASASTEVDILAF